MIFPHKIGVIQGSAFTYQIYKSEVNIEVKVNIKHFYIYFLLLLLIADFLVQFLVVSDPPGGPGKGSLGFESQRTCCEHGVRRTTVGSSVKKKWPAQFESKVLDRFFNRFLSNCRRLKKWRVTRRGVVR